MHQFWESPSGSLKGKFMLGDGMHHAWWRTGLLTLLACPHTLAGTPSQEVGLYKYSSAPFVQRDPVLLTTDCAFSLAANESQHCLGNDRQNDRKDSTHD